MDIMLREVLPQFNFKGTLKDCSIFGSGHINTTYLAVYDDNGTERKYVVQEVKKLSVQLAPYKRPVNIVVRKEPLPRTATRKVKRNVVKEEIMA